jgi:tripartite-type tricarboxylate transporter receptor subunit TctC
MNIKSVITAVIISTLSIGHAGSASTWPDQPVTFIVPFAAGGGGDTAARILQNRLSQELNQPVVIQNLAGASGIVGTAAIKKANSDGLTIGLSLGSTIGTGQIFNQSLPYDYINDFEYIAVLGEIPRGIFVSQNSPYKTVDDLVTASKNQVNTNFGVGGNSPEHLAALIFNAATGGQHQLIPYTANTNTMIIDLLGGRLDAVWQSMPAMASCLQDKSCRPLAFT